MNKVTLVEQLRAPISQKNRMLFLIGLSVVSLIPVVTYFQVVLSGNNTIANNWIVFGAMVIGFSLSAFAFVYYAYKQLHQQVIWIYLFCLVFFGAIWCVLALSVLGATE